jgi:hypothetical protein
LAPELRLVLVAFATLALVAGVLLFVLSDDTDESFSWTIKPPLTAAFLGASYWAACLLFAWSASRRRFVDARPALLPACLIAVLLLIATLIHFDRFHKDLFGWFWLAAYIAVPPILVAALWRQRQVPSDGSDRRVPLPPVLMVTLAIQGAAMVGVGAALYVAPSSADAVWPWSLTPLTAMAVGAFLVGFGAAAFQAVVGNDLHRLAGSALAYLLLGALQLLAAARYTDAFTGSDVDTWIYVAFVCGVLAVGAWGTVSSRRLATAASGSA